jgi:hypothetical protein
MPPIDFDLWSQKSDAVRIFLVETSAARIADGYLLPLYFATQTVILGERCYLGTQIGLPRLTRQANSVLSPNHVSTWGELELAIEPEYRPDAYRSATWLELLSPAWNLRGQPLTILMGGEGFAYSDFIPVFSGRVGDYSWEDASLTLTIYDKTQSLNITMPDYEMPESPQAVEESWGQTVPVILGQVKNYKPILITTTNPGPYPWKYALACHVMEALDAVYGDNAPISYHWEPKDIFPARKDGEGAATMNTYGPYTGSLLLGGWVIQIDSLSTPNSQGNSGPEVGLATFRWKMEGDAAWRGEGILTWKLGYDPATLVKSPAVGAGILAVSGDYAGDCKLPYRVKITRGGDIGDVIPPQCIFSDDGGANWFPNNDAIWTPIAAAPGVSSVVAFNPGDSVLWEITTGGNVGGAVRFKWSRDGGATWTTDVSIPNTAPIELFSGFSIQFTAPAIGGTDDYDAGDAGESLAAFDILDDIENPGNAEPVALNRGLRAEFSGIGGTAYSWAWSGAGDGSGSITQGNPLDVRITITVEGDVGAAQFDWVYHEGEADQESGSGTTSTEEQVLRPGLAVTFSAGSISPAYYAGDGSSLVGTYTVAFVVDDAWAFSFREIPIPLADGVSIQWFTQTGQDFYLWDEWRFILGAALLLERMGDGINLTVDARGLISPALGTYTDLIGELIRAVCVLWAKWSAVEDFDLSALAAFNTAFPYQAGLLVDSPTAIAAIIDQLLTGLPALYTIKNDGRFYLAEIAPVAAAPILALTDVEFLQSPKGTDGDDDLYRRVYLNYDRNPNADKNPKGALSQERVEWLRREFRQLSARDETVLEKYPWATDLKPLDTCLVRRVDAEALADKVLNLLKVKHPQITVLSKNQPFHLNLGDKISVRRSRFDMNAVEVYEIHGAELDFTADEATLNLWR